LLSTGAGAKELGTAFGWVATGSSIEVDTRLGEFTEIKVILPRTAMFV